MTAMDRTEHVAWSKQRALVYADQGDTALTLSSLASDLAKHPETAGHDSTILGTLLAMSGHLSTPAQLREWVEGIS